MGLFLDINLFNENGQPIKYSSTANDKNLCLCGESITILFGQQNNANL